MVYYDNQQFKSDDVNGFISVSVFSGIIFSGFVYYIQQVAAMIGQVYRHKQKDTRYVVVEVANEHAEDHVLWPVLVVYVDENRKTWARPKIEFDINFELAF